MKTSVNVYLILLLSIFRIVSPSRGYRKCCGEGLQLNADRNSCVESNGEAEVSIVESLGLQKVEVGFPEKAESCASYTSFKLRTGENSNFIELLEKGLIETDRYREPILLDSICLDVFNNQTYGVHCDPCTSGLCVKLCCPHGHLKYTGSLGFLSELDEEYQLSDNITFPDLDDIEDQPECELHQHGLRHRLQFWKNSNKTAEFTEGTDYKIDPPEEEFFRCHIDPLTGKRPPVQAYPELSDSEPVYQIHTSGDLYEVGYEDSKRRVRLVAPRGEFCFSNGEVNKDGVWTPEMYYGVCLYSSPPGSCETVRGYIFVAGFITSAVFTALTIIEICLPNLEANLGRSKTEFTLKMGYLCNQAALYIVILIERYCDFEKETIPCKLFGYLLQYFSISYMAWMTVLTVFLRSRIFILNQNPARIDDRKWKIFSFLFAQVFPFVVCLVTLGIDLRLNHLLNQPDIPWFDRHFYPEMGVYACYVGHMTSAESVTHFETPEFIYIQVFQLGILLFNLPVCFQTMRILLKERRFKMSVQCCYKTTIKENFLIFAKLYFFSFGFWFMEIVTSVIVTHVGKDNTCVARTFLDFPNAYFGVITFILLVKNKIKFFKALKEILFNLIFSCKMNLSSSSPSSQTLESTLEMEMVNNTFHTNNK